MSERWNILRVSGDVRDQARPAHAWSNYYAAHSRRPAQRAGVPRSTESPPRVTYRATRISRAVFCGRVLPERGRDAERGDPCRTR